MSRLPNKSDQPTSLRSAADFERFGDKSTKMTIAAASEDPPESWREKDIYLPTDARVLAELLEVRPWQTIADLMEKGVFASQQTAIQDEEVVRSIGKKHGVLFRIASNPEQTGPPNP